MKKVFRDFMNLYSDKKMLFYLALLGFGVFVFVVLYICYVGILKIVNIDFFNENITNWLQAIGGLGSAIIAIYAIIISKKFSTFTKQQNDISLEEFRPKIFAKFDGNIGIINEGNFEANEVDIYLKFGEEKIKQIEKGLIITPLKFVKINLGNDTGYFSIIVKYKNYGSDIYYLYGFNYESGKDIFNVGENYKSKSRQDVFYKSPILEKDYLDLFSSFSIKNQIINNKDVSIDFENFISKY